MAVRVTVIDYGMGNVFSICNALHHCGAVVNLSSESKAIQGADRLVLPGVGAFRDGVENIKKGDLYGDILAFKELGRPLLGICLGMQMLFETSEEFGAWDGLNLISGKVVQIPGQGKNSISHKIPHIGWNGIHPPDKTALGWEPGLLGETHPGTMVYFVHSFHAVPEDRNDLLAVCDYNGLEITAAVKRDNIMGTQFHPEKSGKSGLSIFNQFMGL